MRHGRVVTACWLLGLAVVTGVRVQLWTDEKALWAAAVAHSPEKPRPWINLGQQYARQGAHGMAVGAFAWGSELSLRPGRTADERTRGWAIAETNLAILAANRGDRQDALTRLSFVLARTPYFKTPKRIQTWIVESASSSSLPPSF